MNKFIAVIYATIIAFMSVFPLNAYALDFDSHQVELEWSNAPENTAYIDILVKMDMDDEDYVDFTSPPKKLIGTYIDENGTTKYKYEDLPIDKNSGIAGLNDNGWISLSLHHKSSGGITIWNNTFLNLDSYMDKDGLKRKPDMSNCDILTISKKYDKFKCAYVDENGNVLGITDKSKKSYSMSNPYAVIANGDNVVFRIFGMSPFVEMILISLIYGVPIFLFLAVLYPLSTT